MLKKCLTSLLLITLAVGFCVNVYAEGLLDLSSMTTDELLELTENLTNELAVRGYVLTLSENGGNGSDAEPLPSPVSPGSYSYMLDKWDLYIAIPLSDSVMKVEHWYRFDADNPFEYDHDVTTLNTSDNSDTFSWLDNQHSAFSVIMNDSRNFRLKEETTLVFTIEPESTDACTCYTYSHDKWDLYKATVLSDSIIKIENWYRFDASEENYDFDHTVTVIVIGDPNNDFKWADDNHSSFTVTMQDNGNSRWSEPAMAAFVVQ